VRPGPSVSHRAGQAAARLGGGIRLRKLGPVFPEVHPRSSSRDGGDSGDQQYETYGRHSRRRPRAAAGCKRAGTHGQIRGIVRLNHARVSSPRLRIANRRKAAQYSDQLAALHYPRATRIDEALMPLASKSALLRIIGTASKAQPHEVKAALAAFFCNFFLLASYYI